MQRKRESMSLHTNASDGAGSGWRETIKIVVHALILAMIVRIFFYQPFNIPSGSMKSTLLVGDYLFVSKLAYGYSRYSIPWGIIPFKGRIFASEPKRGDVAVFKLPRDNSTDYIKRIIGLPGDHVQVKQGQLYVNGKLVPRTPAGDFLETNEDVTIDLKLYQEKLPDGPEHLIAKATDEGYMNNTDEYVVPPGHVFCMGDNRDNSQDSRFLNMVGFVPLENLVGRAEFIFFSIDARYPWWEVWEWPFQIRWSRLFTGIT